MAESEQRQAKDQGQDDVEDNEHEVQAARDDAGPGESLAAMFQTNEPKDDAKHAQDATDAEADVGGKGAATTGR